MIDIFIKIYVNIFPYLLIFGRNSKTNKTMKTVITSIITSIITVLIVLAIVHYFCDDDKCAHESDYKKACTEHVAKDHKHHEAHGMCMHKFEDIREGFDARLSDDEKATIEALREKFEDAHCEEMCPEGKKKFMEEHKADFAVLLAIADNHKEFFDGLYAKMHEGCKEHHADGKDMKTEAHKCPEAKTCREATEKCKGEPKKAESKECKEAKEKCEEECFNTFKIHFLLYDGDCEHE